MSSFPGRAYAGRSCPVSAGAGGKEFIGIVTDELSDQVDAVLPADTAAP